jgi:cation-transporting ATPase F
LNAACAALTYLPPLNTAFQTAPLDVQTWLLIAALSVAAWAVVVLDKHIRQRIV